MSETPAYIAVDWGTSSFRLWLLSAAHTVLAERRSHEGMTTAAKAGFANILTSHLQAVQAPAGLPVLICGMAGARQGWKEAGYVDTPAPLEAILHGAVKIEGQDRDIRILPGLAQRATEWPDVIRGEETQLLGAIDPDARDEQTVCMPGTHSKWVRVRDGTVLKFSTYMTGELFDVISRHSILSHAVGEVTSAPFDMAAFRAAVVSAFSSPAMVTNLLFGIRAGTLLHDLSAPAAAARLSGTLIGTELAGALGQDHKGQDVCLVASGRLLELYEQAFGAISISSRVVDADLAVRRGLSIAAGSIWPTLGRTS